MEMTINPNYAAFRSNPFISSIAGTKKWTVSTNQKVPIDIFKLKYRGVIAGAVYNSEPSLTTLDKVNELLPGAANYAFYLDAFDDDFVVLDIESKCPDDIKQKLLQMPCLYCETSMSGKGIHMIFKHPIDIMNKYPDAKQKIVFKENHGYYEVLIAHYVTFTANQIAANISDDNSEFEKFFETMAANQKKVTRADIDIDIVDDVDIPIKINLLNSLQGREIGYRTQTQGRFNGDMSRYEFGYMAHLYRMLINLLNDKDRKEWNQYNNLTDSQIAWFMYKTASEDLPHRPKHEQERNNMPWLLYLAFEVIAKSKNFDNDQTEEE